MLNLNKCENKRYFITSYSIVALYYSFFHALFSVLIARNLVSALNLKLKNLFDIMILLKVRKGNYIGSWGNRVIF